VKYKLVQVIENAEKADEMISTKEIVEFDFNWAERNSVPAVAIEFDQDGEIVGFSVTSACAGLYEVLRKYMLDM
jgi:hypothetical protein